MISRRNLLQAGSLAAALSTQISARTLKAVGVQLYTLRNVLPERPAETLRAIQSIGYREVETGGVPLDKFWVDLEKTQLKPVSFHLDSTLVTKGPEEELERTLADLKKRGFTYAVFPYLPPNERGGLDVIAAFAGKLNRAGEKCRAAGLKFCYHNHAFEFQPMDGKRPIDVLIEKTDPQLVGFELDCFWVSVTGNDPVEMADRLKGRVHLVHVKDKASGTPVRYNESVPAATFKEVGNGVINWTAVLKATAASGAQHYFVEQDQTPGDPIASLRQSFEYINRI
jgi:sugar phosphate isomerase/epimerase